jgi:hypothetical protein
MALVSAAASKLTKASLIRQVPRLDQRLLALQTLSARVFEQLDLERRRSAGGAMLLVDLGLFHQEFVWDLGRMDLESDMPRFAVVSRRCRASGRSSLS